MTECQVCQAEIDGAYLCPRCIEDIERALGDIAGDLDDLEAVATRQARGPLGLGSSDHFIAYEDGFAVPIGGYADGSLGDSGWVYAPGASDLIDAIDNTVTTWARHLCESRGIELPGWVRTTVDASRWLMLSRAAIAQDEWAAQIHDELTSIPHAVTKAVIGRGPQVFAGRCDAEQMRIVHQIVAVERNRAVRADRLLPVSVPGCGAFLHGYEGEPGLTCEGCGASYSLAERRKALLSSGELDDAWLPLRQLVEAFTELDYPVNLDTLKTWVQRDKRPRSITERPLLRQVGIDDDGVALYRAGDVRDRIAWARRRSADRAA